jgi:hypothetical protein
LILQVILIKTTEIKATRIRIRATRARVTRIRIRTTRARATRTRIRIRTRTTRARVTRIRIRATRARVTRIRIRATRARVTRIRIRATKAGINGRKVHKPINDFIWWWECSLAPPIVLQINRNKSKIESLYIVSGQIAIMRVPIRSHKKSSELANRKEEQ